MLGDAYEYLVWVMPSVATCIVWWRWKATAWQSRLPVGLSFQVLAMASGAMRIVDRAAESHLFLHILSFAQSGCRKAGDRDTETQKKWKSLAYLVH
jgi:hypothetical protein